jgi:hypothetical protein
VPALIIILKKQENRPKLKKKSYLKDSNRAKPDFYDYTLLCIFGLRANYFIQIENKIRFKRQSLKWKRM